MSLLMTRVESKIVGWGGETIQNYPEKVEFEAAVSAPNRVQLVTWHRYLRSPQNPKEQVMMRRLIKVLEETCEKGK